MTTQAETRDQIPIGEIKKYRDVDIPIRPIKADGTPDVFSIFYDGEVNKILYNLSGNLRKWVYKNEKVQHLKLLAVQPLSPKDFWTDERIVSQNWSGIECQTGFNASLSSIVIGIDADDEKPKAIVRGLITEYGLDGKTIIQRTPHGGLHLIVKIPCKVEDIEIWRKRALYLELCKNGCKIEIKTTTMGITLSPSRHRKDHLSYTRESVVALAEVPQVFYLRLVDELKSNGCLWETPEEHYTKLEEQEKADFTSPDPNVKRCDLTDSEITDAINIILGKDGRGVNSAYVVGHRHVIVTSLAGHLYYRYITKESVKTLIEKLGEAAGDSHGDIRESLIKIDDIWARGDNKQRIRGKSGLIEAFARLKDGDLTFGQERFMLLTEAFNLDQTSTDNETIAASDTNTLIGTAGNEIPFFFMNHLNRPCAVVKVVSHYEVMEINTEPFLMILRRIWQAANPNRLAVSDNIVKHARSALVAKMINPENQTIRTHLRVAWKEPDKVLRYDLTNTLWQQVEISSSGVKILSSKTMLDEIKEYAESGYDKHKVPVLFQRYSNTKEQVIPAKDFEPDVLDRYMWESTNVTDKRAEPSAKRFANHWKTEASMSNDQKVLIAKVLLTHMFIPDVPHFLVNLIGPSGANKTNYLKKWRRIVDPAITEVFSSHVTSKDIEQRFAQNYLVILDNVTEIQQWLSNLICAVVTGTGTEKRELYSNEGIVNSILKSCICVGSINRVFSTADAITRMAVQEFLEVDESVPGNYKAELEIEEHFENIRPKLLGCIFDILSKVIKIKENIIGRSKRSLGRMIDALEWSDIISQAMGNPEGKFLDTFGILKSIQLTHAVKNNILSTVYENLYYEIFTDPDKKKEYNDVRFAGCMSFTYDDLQKRLNSIAESEGFKITGKGNPWPKDNLQLRERTREIAPQLRKTSNILVEIRSQKNGNEFIIGHRDGVENYLEVIREEGDENASQNDKSAEVEDIRYASKITVDTCALIVQEKNGEAVRGDNLLKEVSQRNSSAQVYIGDKFLPRNNWKLRAIYMELQQRPGIELVCNRPTYIFRWNKNSNKDLVLPRDARDVLPEKQCDGRRIFSFSAIHCISDHEKHPLIHAMTSTPIDHGDEKSFSNSEFFSDSHHEHHGVIPDIGEPPRVRYRPDVRFCDGNSGLILNQWPVKLGKTSSHASHATRTLAGDDKKVKEPLRVATGLEKEKAASPDPKPASPSYTPQTSPEPGSETIDDGEEEGKITLIHSPDAIVLTDDEFENGKT